MDPNNPQTPQSSNPHFDPSTYELNTQQRQFSPLDNTPPLGGYVGLLNQGMSSSPIPQPPLFGSSSPNMFSQPQPTPDQIAQFQRWQLQMEFERLQQRQQQLQQQPPQQPQQQPPQERLRRTKQISKRRGKSTRKQSLIDEDDDVEFVPETQQPPPPPPQQEAPPPPPPRRSGHWNEDEEETLMKAWIGISTDAKTGTDQSGKAFFQRVHERFCALMGNPNHRTYDACNSKWRDLKKEVTDFAGAFNKVTNENASGSNQLDAYKSAAEIFKARNGNREFAHYKAWRLARDHGIRWGDTPTSDMWAADSSGSNKRARTSESEPSFNLDLNDDATDDANEEAEFEAEPMPPASRRPIGRDKAKKAGKGVASEPRDDPLVGTWKQSMAFAKEKAERKEKKREMMFEEQRKLWESQQQMIQNQNLQFEHQKRMWEKHDLLMEQQNETLKEQQLLASVDILCRVPDEGVDEESKQEIERIKAELRARRAGRRF